MRYSSELRRSDKVSCTLLAVLLAMLVGGLEYSLAPASTPRGERPELRWGTPTAVEAEHAGYVRGHCGHYTEWVAEYLTAERLAGDVPREGNDFTEDPQVPAEFRARHKHYRNSGYDRGHMPPAADMHGDPMAMRDCHLLSAMMPQTPALNEGHEAWEGLETHVRSLAAPGAGVWVFTGVAFVPGDAGEIHVRTLDGVVWVPTHCWKAALVERGNRLELHAWLIPNVPEPPHWQSCAVSVDEIEAAAGLDLFDKLDDELEEKLEAAK